MRKFWMLGLFGGALMSVATADLSGGAVTTKLKGIEIGGEVRARYTHNTPDYYDQATHAGITRGRTESDDSGMLRTRLRADLDAGDNVKGTIELQGVHVNGATAVGVDDGTVTVRQGYLFASDLMGQPLDLKVGRMALWYGNGDLLSSSDWANASHHFDGAVLSFRANDKTKIDLGYAELVNGDVNDGGALGSVSGSGGLYPARVAGTASDPDEDYDIYWLWLTSKITDEFTADVYDIMEYDGENDYRGETLYAYASDNWNGGSQATALDVHQGHLKRHTSGFQLNYDNGDFYGNAQWNGQWGRLATDQIRAWGYAAHVGMRFDKEGANHDASVGIREASGESDPNDQESTRFRPLFSGSSHGYNGIQDMVGWTNSTAVFAKYGFNPMDKLRLTTTWTKFERHDMDDSWYTDAGAVLRTGAGFDANNPDPKMGTSGSSDIGHEIDFVLNYTHSDFLDFEAGFSHFFQGRLALDTADTSDAEFTYVQARLRF
ncbi:MAG: alginate export family protein [Planctomycetota bacterium]